MPAYPLNNFLHKKSHVRNSFLSYLALPQKYIGMSTSETLESLSKDDDTVKENIAKKFNLHPINVYHIVLDPVCQMEVTFLGVEFLTVLYPG